MRTFGDRLAVTCGLFLAWLVCLCTIAQEEGGGLPPPAPWYWEWQSVSVTGTSAVLNQAPQDGNSLVIARTTPASAGSFRPSGVAYQWLDAGNGVWVGVGPFARANGQWRVTVGSQSVPITLKEFAEQ